MKTKISISIEENSIEKLEEYVKEGQFRNKSHIIEYALNKFLKEIKK
jgi:Arc/MetJ-type ribon-helix-helix transcriptional regulator